jgi:RNA polymerase sigma-70 factor (ECF subfamily)
MKLMSSAILSTALKQNPRSSTGMNHAGDGDTVQRSALLREERELVLRSIQHDQQAFGQLYDRFVDKIYKYIYYRVNSKTEAEDLTAHVFLKSWEAIGRYHWTDRPFGAWLYRIAHNVVVDYFRTHRDIASLDDATATEHIGSDFEDVIEHQMTADSLRIALSRLTHDQQEVIILKFLEGYNTTEIAEILGKQEGAVRTLQHRALTRLTAMFSQQPDQF